MQLLDEDLPYVFDDLGFDVSLAGVTTRGIWEELPVEAVTGPVGSMQGVVKAILIQQGTLPAIARGATPMVDGISFTVREVQPAVRGRCQRVLLMTP